MFFHSTGRVEWAIVNSGKLKIEAEKLKILKTYKNKAF